MCTRLKQGTSIISPGVLAQYKTLSMVLQGHFGLNFGQGPIYNAREETLYEFWHKKNAQRGIIEVSEFYEKGLWFGIPGDFMRIGCLYMPSKNFVIVTTSANGKVVPYHHRMPLIISNENRWMTHGEVTHGGHNIKIAA